MATETTYNIVKVEELRLITQAEGADHIIINDVDSVPLETKKITAEDFALSIKDYILPIATDEILGGIKVGQGLTINPNTGVLTNDIYALNDLNDVQIANPSNREVLSYDGTKWVNRATAGPEGVIAGDGLSGGGFDGEVTLHVNAGFGIRIADDRVCTDNGQGFMYSGNKNTIDIGPGLTFLGNSVSVNTGNGLLIDASGVSVAVGRGLKYDSGLIVVDTGYGLSFSNNQLVVQDATHDQKGICQFAKAEDVVLFVNDSTAVTPAGLGATRGIANGMAPLDENTELNLDYLPKIPANKLKTVPVQWVENDLNWDKSSNFFLTHNVVDTEVQLGAVTTDGYLGDSGFIYVANPTQVKLNGINNSQWKAATYTWFDVDAQEESISSDVLISYYIAAPDTVIYTASGIS